MSKTEKIKADIDRLQETTMDKNSNFKSQYDQGIFDGLSLIDNFIDSLEEEPVSNDLEEAVNAYIGYAPEVDECSSVYGKRQAFKAGAQWQKERMIEKACEWIKYNNENGGCIFDGWEDDFKKYIKG